jgi:hypothetical protein
MGLLSRYRRLPYLEPEKQRFLLLEIVSLLIIVAGCITMLIALVFENISGGLGEEEAMRIIRISTGFFMVIVGLVLLLGFMYRHVSALEQKLYDLKAPKEPEAYKGGIEISEYAELREKERTARERPLTEEEKKALKVKEAKELARRMKELEESFDKKASDTTYKKCPMCGALYTEDWDVCPKCGAKVR